MLKDVEKKVRKFIDIVEAVKSGKETYFSITRLTSLKGLCKDAQTAAHFVFYLAERTLTKVGHKPYPSHLAEEDWKNFKKLMSESIQAMRTHLEQPTADTLSTLRNLHTRIGAAQGHTEVRVWGRVIRSIQCWDALIVEDALHCILSPHAAAELAYKTARDYTEKYDPRYGTGLVPASVPMLEDIIQFWNGYSRVEPIESASPTGDTFESIPTATKRRRSARKARKTDTSERLKLISISSFEERYPNVAAWFQNGWIEIGCTEGSRSFIRALDEGGMVWEGKNRYLNVDEALEDAEKGIQDWLAGDA